jgi:peptidoglycan hydrolase-like amidase
MLRGRKYDRRRRALRWGLSLTVGLISLLSGTEARAQEIQQFDLSLPAKRIITQLLREPVDAVAINLKGMQLAEVQILEREGWSSWELLMPDTDAFPTERNSQLLYADEARAVRLRSPTGGAVTLHAIAVSSKPIRWDTVAAGRQLSPRQLIITRKQWGADEDLRLAKEGKAKDILRLFETQDPMLSDQIRNCELRAKLYPEEFREINRRFMNEEGQPLLWPQGYSEKIDIVVLHHTAESTTDAAKKKSGLERMRALYAYHAVSRGWGDIGYHYLIDEDGNIFEGRAGGPYVVGAHTYCHNVGTIGIALMGNFQSRKPDDPQLQALRLLLVHLADQYDLDFDNRPLHHGKPTPTIVGHRDLRATACPGIFSHELLPQIRTAANERDVIRPLYSTNTSVSTDYEALLLSAEEPLKLHMGQRKELKVVLRNKGKEAWNNRSWLLGEGDAGMFFTQIRPHSFIAGFLQEEEVKPGEVGTFIAQLQAGLQEGRGTVNLLPVINNNRKLLQSVARIPFEILPSSPRYTFVTAYFPPLHRTGEDLTGTIKILNSGSVPWDRNTITELEFAMGGGGDVSILNLPESIGPGEQGSFQVRFHNVQEVGQYQRTLHARFLDGSPLEGAGIVIASSAQPVPDIAYTASPSQLLAQSQQAFQQGRATQSEGVSFEVLTGTTFTLAPEEQIPIPLRIRAGRRSVSQGQVIAQVQRSHPAIVLQGEKNRRISTVFTAPASLLEFQTFDTTLTLIAPRRPGEYSVTIGEIQLALMVRTPGRLMVQEQPLPRITPRTITEQVLTFRRQERRLRRLRTAPPHREIQGDKTIRIKLSYTGESTILTSSSPLEIAGEGGIIVTESSVNLTQQQNFCRVITANGELLAPILRFTPLPSSGSQRGEEGVKIQSWGIAANHFRGTLECRILDGELILINELPLETYLLGLAEEPDTEPPEKQRAFAIAARSYALYYLTSGERKFPGKPYDGSDSPASFQKYSGIDFEKKNPRWAQAVRDTAGKVLTWERRVIKAPYHSSNDGRTRSALEVWGWEHTPYLPSVPDPWCEGLNNWGHGVGMSGCGAKAQALEGKTAEEILQHYYPGAKILRWQVLEGE